MANSTVSHSEKKVNQAREKLGAIALNLEQDLNKIASCVNSLSNNWKSSRTDQFISSTKNYIESVNTEQKTLIENIRKYLDGVNVKYSTIMKKMTSNAERFKK